MVDLITCIPVLLLFRVTDSDDIVYQKWDYVVASSMDQALEAWCQTRQKTQRSAVPKAIEQVSPTVTVVDPKTK